MTELIYQTDSYARAFDATVLKVHPEDHAIVLDRTAFYPGGGGKQGEGGKPRVELRDCPQRGLSLERGRRAPLGSDPLLPCCGLVKSPRSALNLMVSEPIAEVA